MRAVRVRTEGERGRRKGTREGRQGHHQAAQASATVPAELAELAALLDDRVEERQNVEEATEDVMARWRQIALATASAQARMCSACSSEGSSAAQYPPAHAQGMAKQPMVGELGLLAKTPELFACKLHV